MANQKQTGRSGFLKNFLFLGAIVTAGIAGYLMLTRQTNTSLPTDPVNPGTDPMPEPEPCQASAAEFPLKKGSGYSSNPNAKCEQQYVKNVQTVLNKFLSRDKKNLLTVDGKFGILTENAIKSYYGGEPVISKWLYDSMMNYF
jgi:hypothetical protein